MKNDTKTEETDSKIHRIHNNGSEKSNSSSDLPRVAALIQGTALLFLLAFTGTTGKAAIEKSIEKTNPSEEMISETTSEENNQKLTNFNADLDPDIITEKDNETQNITLDHDTPLEDDTEKNIPTAEIEESQNIESVETTHKLAENSSKKELTSEPTNILDVEDQTKQDAPNVSEVESIEVWPALMKEAFNEYRYFRPHRLKMLSQKVKQHYQNKSNSPQEAQLFLEDVNSYRLLRNQQKLDSTAKNLSQLDKRYPNGPKTQRTLALRYLALDYIENAIYKTERIDPSKRKNDPLWAWIETRQKQHASSEPYNKEWEIKYEALSQKYPHFFPFQEEKLTIALQNKNYKKAEDIASDLLVKEPKDALIRKILMSAMFEQNKWKKTQNLAQSLLDEGDNSFNVQLAYLKSSRILGDHTKIDDFLQKNINHQTNWSKNEKALFALEQGKHAFNTKNYKKSIDQLSMASTALPKHYSAHVFLGAAKHQTGDYKAAYEDFRKAIILQPRNAAAYKYLAISLYMMGLYPQAQKEFENAITLGDKNPDTLYQLSLSQERQGNTDGAVLSLNKALQTQSNYTLAKQKLAQLQAAKNQSPQ